MGYPLSPEALGILTDEVRKGVGAQTLLRVMGPVLDERLEMLLNQLDHCPPSLNELLDLRAKISYLRTLRRELNQAAQVGIEAGEKLASTLP